jgi:hypothetical protein
MPNRPDRPFHPNDGDAGVFELRSPPIVPSTDEAQHVKHEEPVASDGEMVTCSSVMGTAVCALIC